MFKFIKLNNNKYDVMIFATSSISPLNHLDKVAAALQENGYTNAIVLFDSLLVTGDNEKRFKKARFTNGFVTNSFVQVNMPQTDTIRSLSEAVLKNL